MEKMDGKSLDIAKMNIEKIKDFFPSVVTEGKINFDTLRALLGDEIDESREKYQFTWNGKSQAIKSAQTPSSSTLRPCKEKSKEWDNTHNLYIEGDNLEVLKQLQKTYFGKIKMIYIDPPYNTGNDFVYKDDFKNSIDNYKEQTMQGSSSNPETSGRYHTDWLNMMYPRLHIARNLLKENGVIFISIDDNEIANLKKICDEIFGETNYLSTISVIVKTEGRRYGGFAKTHEYILVYAKNNEYVELNEVEIEGKEFQFFDDNGGFNIQDLRNQNARAFNSKNRPNLRYPFYVDLLSKDNNGFCKVYLEKKDNFEEVYPIITNGYESIWRWGKKEKASKQINELVARKGSDGVIRIFQKMRKLTEMPKTVLNDKDFISIKGTKELQTILGCSAFDFPKPSKLIKLLIQIGSNDDDIIVDFFSGSATTAHAIFQQNIEDNGRRHFILAQLPERIDENSEAYMNGYKTLCDIGEERIRRTGEQIKKEWESKNKGEGLLTDNSVNFPFDIGFKIFKLDTTNINSWDNLKIQSEIDLFNQESVFKADRSKEDILYEIMLKYGIFDLQVTSEKVNGKDMFNVGSRYMFVCLEDEITSEDIKKICEFKPKIVVFKESGFANDNDKVNAVYNLERAGVEDVKCI